MEGAISVFDIKEELKKLPEQPGVYIMKEGDTILYVGKAVNLKNRVRQYFQSPKNKTAKILRMISRIEYFEYIVTDTEMEALILENNLIKEHRPPYNTLLKDDKQYPYIKATVYEAFPRIFITRKVAKDKARYFGPYTSMFAVRQTLDLMQQIWPLRHCNRALPKDIGKERPCLNYHIGRCIGPCTGKVTQEEYHAILEKAMDFLSGHHQEVIQDLKAKMMDASEALDFERAARLRDQIKSVEFLSQRQKIDDAGSDENRDVIAYATAGDDVIVQSFFIRNGRLIGQEHFFMDGAENQEAGEILAAFIQQFYAGTPYIPKELVVMAAPDNSPILEEWLTSRKGQKVHITVPLRGEKAKLIGLARQNAQLYLSRFGEKMKHEEKKTRGAVRQLEQILGADPDESYERIEAYDISNTFGFQSVGSMVVFEGGKPKNPDYRKFRIQTVQGANDYASMAEMLRRRFRHAFSEIRELDEKDVDLSLGRFTRLPDLILMDGGRGQVHVAQSVLSEFNLDIPVAGMVKDDRHRTRALYYQDRELTVDPHSDAFHLITRIQDEAHRFAITYHKKLRWDSQIQSLLDQIPGIGPKRRASLLQTFGSVEKIRSLSSEELMKADGINQKAADAIFQFFHQPSDPPAASEIPDNQ